MLDCICYTEEYLYASKNNPNFYNILHSISDVNIISVLPQNRRGIYGQTFPDIHAILINPELSGSKTLTPAEITRLYTAHELGHCINENWMQSVLNHINEQIRLGNIRNREELPEKAKKYLNRIEEIVKVPISFIGVGAGRECMIVCKK